ncbi:MAG: SDR family oxidoreductase [Planctomycetota bacterium]
MATDLPASPRLLLAGATGYVGGRLLRALEARGEPLRCLARRPEDLAAGRPGSTEVVRGDVFDPASLATAMAGIHTAWYLIHSMGSAGDFESRDREAASSFAEAAARAGVRRIIYLGGSGRSEDGLSTHLRSRQEVGRVLASTGVPVIELRASISIGSGSLSFEMVRALTERLPVLITPRWVGVEAQPILVTDVIAYLLAARDLPEGEAGVFEIGGADVCTYGDLIREYARQRGLKRTLLPVPFLTPRLSSLWLGLVTPVYARVGRKLIDSIRHPTVVTDDRAARTFPDIHPCGVREAIERVLRKEADAVIETRWCDAVSSAGEVRSLEGRRLGARRIDRRSHLVGVPPARAFAPVRQIGGRRGWYYGNALWRLRGFLDLLVGGVGLRRGRRDPDDLRVGEPLDFWRVEAYEPDHRLLLRAEMKVPGRAWLEFTVEPEGEGSRIWQTAVFDPLGVSGRLYWYAVWPLHVLVFRGMLRRIAEHAERVTPPASSARS